MNVQEEWMVWVGMEVQRKGVEKLGSFFLVLRFVFFFFCFFFRCFSLFLSCVDDWKWLIY